MLIKHLNKIALKILIMVLTYHSYIMEITTENQN